MFRRIVTFDGLCLDRDGGVSALEELRPIGDGAYNVAGTQSERRSECRERCNQHRQDDFDKLFLVHSLGCALISYNLSRRRPLLPKAEGRSVFDDAKLQQKAEASK